MLDVKALIAGKSLDEVRQIVHDLVVKEVSEILRLGPERIDPQRSLYDLGMDSLMAMELALGIEKRFGISLPAMALNEGPSVERISARLTACLSGAEVDTAGARDTLEDLVRTMAVQHSEDITAHEISETVADVRREALAGARLIP
jgi:acyl carrier protein